MTHEVLMRQCDPSEICQGNRIPWHAEKRGAGRGQALPFPMALTAWLALLSGWMKAMENELPQSWVATRVAR